MDFQGRGQFISEFPWGRENSDGNSEGGGGMMVKKRFLKRC